MADVVMEALQANWEYIFIVVGIVWIAGSFKGFGFVTQISGSSFDEIQDSSCLDDIKDGSMMARVIFGTIGLALVVMGVFGLLYDWY